MGDRLEEYRRKRDADRTPEPVPDQLAPGGRGDQFVVQQHHARRLHWDLRLERDGVLVSWALPRGVPRDPADNHLAVHTEDHPLAYAAFHGEIPAGEYGAGRMTIYDRGTYTTEKWRDGEVMVQFHGGRVTGRYVLFHTRGKDWMIHRMDPPEPGWEPMPERIAPMLPGPARRLPPDDDAWGYEMTWDGLRAAAYVSMGRLRLVSDGDRDVTGPYPELRGLVEALAPTECVLDGELVVLDPGGRPDLAALRRRREAERAGSAAVRRLAAAHPVQYLVFDLLWLDGHSTVDLPYRQRRELLDGLGLAGRHWQVPPYFPGGGEDALRASRELGLAGVTAKRLDSPYQPGHPDRHWLRVSAG
jgi:bifunctional non-homologous end joining protein LigD